MRGVVVWWGKFGNVKSSWGSGSKTSRGWNRLRESIVASVLVVRGVGEGFLLSREDRLREREG